MGRRVREQETINHFPSRTETATMPTPEDRRRFLKTSSLAAAGFSSGMLANTATGPAVDFRRESEGWDVPGYPQKMQGMEKDQQMMKAIWSRKEARGMRTNYPMAVKSLMTVMRVLPDDLFQLVMESDKPVEKGAVFAEIVRRFGDPERYKAAQKIMERD